MRRALRAIVAVVTVAAVPPFVLTAFAASQVGSVSSGQDIYDRQCLVCHSLEREYHKEGPSLYKIWGKNAGTVPYFGKYKALKGANGIVWNEKTLDQWLTDPRSMVDGRDTGMTLRLEDAQQRADVIAYLKSLK